MEQLYLGNRPETGLRRFSSVHELGLGLGLGERIETSPLSTR